MTHLHVTSFLITSSSYYYAQLQRPFMMAKEAQVTSTNDQVAFDTDPQGDSSLSANTSAAARNETQEVESVLISDVSVEKTEVERVRSTQVTVETTGIGVSIRDSSHAFTNHYIKQSRTYFPNEKLPIYIDCPFFYTFARLLWFASLFGILVAAGKSEYLYLPVAFFVSCLLFFLIYCQHEWVNQKSLPVVFKQPVIENPRSENDFYQITITELGGIALQNYEAGVGFVQLSQGKIEFQAFNKRAIRNMSNSKRRSRLMLCLFFLASLYNGYFMVAYTLGVGTLF